MELNTEPNPSQANSDFSQYSPALGDWRLAVATWMTGYDNKMLAVPLPINQVTTHHAQDIHLTFPTPSAAALHLNASWHSARRGFELREKLVAAFHSAAGQPLQMSFQGTASGPLFDFFEEMIGTVSGACAAVEAFCNRCIIDNATGPLKVKARKGKDSLSPEDVVRFTPLDEKVKRIVPDIMGVPSPAGKEVYDRFVMFKNLRDSVTHFKRHDEARIAGKLHEPTPLTTLFFTDQFIIPESAMDLMRYLAPGEKAPRWLMNPAWVRPIPKAIPQP
jgi:hypothetical protein